MFALCYFVQKIGCYLYLLICRLAEALYVEKSIISYYENDKKEMRASGLAEIAKVHQTTPNYLLGFADNNDGFADEALGLLRDVKDQSVREILLKQIRALI